MFAPTRRTSTVKKLKVAIATKTKALVVVHHAGLACEMDDICRIAKDHNLVLIEDAAQAIGSTYRGRSLGSFGAMSAFSFHETKNPTSRGEGEVIAVNNPDLVNKAVVARDK